MRGEEMREMAAGCAARLPRLEGRGSSGGGGCGGGWVAARLPRLEHNGAALKNFAQPTAAAVAVQAAAAHATREEARRR
eukprot:5119371-Prymnesium_polylepis.2